MGGLETTSIRDARNVREIDPAEDSVHLSLRPTGPNSGPRTCYPSGLLPKLLIDPTPMPDGFIPRIDHGHEAKGDRGFDAMPTGEKNRGSASRRGQVPRARANRIRATPPLRAGVILLISKWGHGAKERCNSGVCRSIREGHSLPFIGRLYDEYVPRLISGNRLPTWPGRGSARFHRAQVHGLSINLTVDDGAERIATVVIRGPEPGLSPVAPGPRTRWEPKGRSWRRSPKSVRGLDRDDPAWRDASAGGHRNGRVPQSG